MTQSIKRLQFPQDFWAETWRKYKKLYIVLIDLSVQLYRYPKQILNPALHFLNNFIINIWFFNEKSYMRQTGRLKQYYMG
jgi:hypothetical protein